jgi:hypothetical protein
MKQSTIAPEGVTDQGRELESRNAGQQKGDDAADTPLPHEAEQSPESQHEEGTREVGEQAHRDVERGLVDTDRRGGDEYQKQTQRDEHANVNSSDRTRRGPERVAKPCFVA